MQRLAELFELTLLDRQILAVAAAPDLDFRCAAALSALGTGNGGLHVTPALAAQLLVLCGHDERAVLERLAALAPLRSSHILYVTGAEPFPLRSAVVADPVVELLRTGRSTLDDRLSGVARLRPGEGATSTIELDLSALAAYPDAYALVPLLTRDRALLGAPVLPRSQHGLDRGDLDPALARLLADVAQGDFPVAASAADRVPGVVRLGCPGMRWSDLVLEPPTRAHLLEVAAAARLRRSQADAWHVGGPSQRGRGVSALFHGPSGTGKTSAAEALAADLGVDLLTVDLATVVSKYIGETEKNLRRVFDVARESEAVLLFDEAEALFGRRSPVRDAHDRYANIEIAYLLQLLDAFDGVAVLTSNLSASLDPAFARRLGYVVEFRAPDTDARSRLWKRMLGEAPRGDDLDVTFLADAFGFTGGDIRNAALHASVMAAANGGPVGMTEALLASARESTKLNRVPVPEQLGRWAEDVEARLAQAPRAVPR
jgi:hypothetical protein